MGLIKKEDYTIYSKLYCVVGLFIYKLILDYSFYKWISPLYSYYMQLKLIVNYKKVILSFIIMLVLVIVTKYDEKRLSNILMVIQLVVMLIPMLTLYGYSNRSTIFMLAVSGAYATQAIILRIYDNLKLKKWTITIDRADANIIIFLIILLGIAILYTYKTYGIGSFAALHLGDVYEIRSNIDYSFPFSYIIPWVFKVVCLFVLIQGIYHKNKLLICLGFFSQFYFFLIYANKTTLFSLGLVIICYFVYLKLDIIKSVIYGLIGLILASGIIYIFSGNYIILSYLVRRTLFVPATIKFAYYDYFNSNDFLHFANNSIGHLLGIESHYSMEAPKLIAKYLGVPDSYCNTGYWGDAYANFGIAGIIVFSLLLIVLIIFMENVTEGISRNIVFPIMIALFYYLNDSALLTWILGGGAGLTIFMFWLYRNTLKEKEYAEKIQKNNL